VISGHDFFWLEHGDHGDTGSADAHSDEPEPVVWVRIGDLVMHDVAARFPEGLACNDYSGLFTLQLEEHLALQYVSEDRPGMAMRRDSGVGRWQFEELCHRMRSIGHGRGSGTEEICFLDVSVTQHGQIPLTDASRQGIASRASAAADDGEFRKRIVY
jgi:hypothetical protein